MIPFTAEQFFEVFAAYNRGIWPAQLVLVGLAGGHLAGAPHSSFSYAPASRRIA